MFRLRKLSRQGLFFYKGDLYESVGQYNSSRFLKRSLNGHRSEILDYTNMKLEYFGEGADFYEDSSGNVYFYQMTWRERKIVRYDKNMKLLDSFTMPYAIKEGWGLSHDPLKQNNIYYVSDGSDIVHECDITQNLKVIKSHRVSLIDQV